MTSRQTKPSIDQTFFVEANRCVTGWRCTESSTQIIDPPEVHWRQLKHVENLLDDNSTFPRGNLQCNSHQRRETVGLFPTQLHEWVRVTQLSIAGVNHLLAKKVFKNKMSSIIVGCSQMQETPSLRNRIDGRLKVKMHRVFGVDVGWRSIWYGLVIYLEFERESTFQRYIYEQCFPNGACLRMPVAGQLKFARETGSHKRGIKFRNVSRLG